MPAMFAAFIDGVIIKVLTVFLTLTVYLVYMLKMHVGLTIGVSGQHAAVVDRSRRILKARAACLPPRK